MAENDLLSDLTPEQRDAVTQIDGPLLILAGPGSGKTRVITRRIAWMLQQGVNPANILAITFTNKSAGEMRKRVQSLVPNSRVQISTFHSFGVRLLRQYGDQLGIDKNFSIYDTADRNMVIRHAYDSLDLSRSRFTPESIGAAISSAKNEMLTLERYAATRSDYFGQTVCRVWPIYEERLRAANSFDFDDLLLIPTLALRRHPELRAELDERFKYLMIDEYQDTNDAQYEMARRLSQDHPNVCVVGDADQSIYGWRGANIGNILNFERDFPNARVIFLSRNYRSTKNILAAADALIAHNNERKPRRLFTDNVQGEPVRVLTFDSGLDEADRVAARIREAVAKGKRRYRDFAVFYRINALSRTLESAFMKHGIPYQIVRGLAFYDRKEVRDIIAYLRLLCNPRDSVAFHRVVNEPLRGIGKITLNRLELYAIPREMSLLSAAAEANKIADLKGRAMAALQEFAKTMADLRSEMEEPPHVLISHLLDRSGYRAALRESAKAEDEERLANVEELITAAKQFYDEDPDRNIEQFLEKVALVSDADGHDAGQDSVSVMSLHASKGLEFPVVYMLAVEQGTLPHERALRELADLEEERRLCFVGMTRAQEELFLCHARVRDKRGVPELCIASQFLDELPVEGVERIEIATRVTAPSPAERWRGGSDEVDAAWSDTGIVPPKKTRNEKDKFFVGAPVLHRDYGIGQVLEVTGAGFHRKIRVRFAKAGEKVFMADIAQLDIVQT